MTAKNKFQFNETYLIKPNEYASITIDIKTTDITYLFKVEVKQNPNSSDDIIVYIVDEQNYQKYVDYINARRNGNTSYPTWASFTVSKVYWSSFLFEPPSQGRYHLILDNIHSTFTSKTVTIKAKEIMQRDEETPQLEEEKRVSEGAIAIEPGSPWSLGTKLEEILSNSKNKICISSPYIDNTTFTTLENVPKNTKIFLIISEDFQMSTKVNDKRVTSQHVKKIITKKQIQIKKISNLHTRFLISDVKLVMHISTDIQTQALSSKYQLGFWTDSQSIVNTTQEYFDKLWGDSSKLDIVKSIKEIEKKKKYHKS